MVIIGVQLTPASTVRSQVQLRCSGVISEKTIRIRTVFPSFSRGSPERIILPSFIPPVNAR